MGLAPVGKSLIDALEGKEDKPPRLPHRTKKPEMMENLQMLCDVLAELNDDDLLPWVASEEKPSQQDLDRAAAVIADRMCGACSDPIIRNAQERRQLATLRRWLRRNGYREISTKDGKDPYAMPLGPFAFRLSLLAGDAKTSVKIPIDCVVKPLNAQANALPILWVWEHRTADFAPFLAPQGKKKPRRRERRRQHTSPENMRPKKKIELTLKTKRTRPRAPKNGIA
jgi:hypothetical protein